MSDTYVLVPLGNGTSSICALEVGETFHPVVGPVAEAEALYVREGQLLERFARTGGQFVIWDVGLGGAGNALTAINAVRDLPGSLRIVSFDRTTDALRFALDHAAALGYVRGYEAHAKRLIETGRATWTAGDLCVHWHLEIGDFAAPETLERWDRISPPDLMMFDPHSPARNPEMWTLGLFERLHARLEPRRGCLLATYSRSTLLRVTLLLAGFFVGRGRGVGEKEETTVASNDPGLIRCPLDRSWLARVRRSRSAEPLRAAVYCQLPLRAESWERLERHAQFRG